MSGMVPFGKNKSRGELTPYGIMRSFLQDPFFGELTVSPLFSSWGGVRADVKDAGNEYIVEAELPGVARDKINLDINDGVLTISANEEAEQKEEKSDYVYRERRWGSYSRSFALENVNESAVTAEYKDGVLTVRLPKAEQEKKSARKIQIN